MYIVGIQRIPTSYNMYCGEIRKLILEPLLSLAIFQIIKSKKKSIGIFRLLDKLLHVSSMTLLPVYYQL